MVETGDFFETVPINSLGPEIDDSQAQLFYKPEETDVALAAKSSYFGRVYLDWAIFPYVQSQELEGEVRGFFVAFQDLRYSYPESRGDPPLGGYVVLGPDLRVEEEGMNSTKSPSPESLEHQPARP